MSGKQTIYSYGGTATTAAILDLRGPGSYIGNGPYNKCGEVIISLNGPTGSDYWVQPIAVADGTVVPDIATDPRNTGAGTSAAWYQLKFGETVTFGHRNSKGYDPAIHGPSGFYTHVQVWCQAPGTQTASQLRIVAQ